MPAVSLFACFEDSFPSNASSGKDVRASSREAHTLQLVSIHSEEVPSEIHGDPLWAKHNILTLLWVSTEH